MKNTTSKLTTRSNGSLLDRARQQSEAKFWKPTEPDTGIEGKVVRIVRDAGKYRSNFYHIETEADGVQIVAGGESTVLGKKLNDLQVEVGDKIAILYLRSNVQVGPTVQELERRLRKGQQSRGRRQSTRTG